MSIFTFIADLRGLRTEAKRIADALDRAYPLPAAAGPAADEKDVSYATDEASARQELLEEAERQGWKFDSEGNLISAPEEAEEEPSEP